MFFWMSLIVSTEILIGVQFAGNLKFSVWQVFFDGTSFQEISGGHVSIPILWFCYLIIPSLILLNSTGEMLEKDLIKLHGLGFTKTQMAINNMLLTSLTTVFYVAITLVVLLIFKKIPNYYLGLGIIVTSFSLQLMQLIIQLFNLVVSLFIPVMILIGTMYSSNEFNPINITMLLRMDSIQTIQLLIIELFGVVILCWMYIEAYRYKDL